MPLLSRLKDLVRANINDLISKAEDPEKSLNLYIEDATEQLRQFKVEVSRFEADRIQLVDQIKHCQAAIDDWHEKAKLALQQSEETLARQALERETHEKNRLSKLQGELAEAKDTSEQLKEQLQLLEEKLEEAREKRDDLIRRNRRAVAQKGAADAIAGVSLVDPLSKFDRMEEKVERREAEAKAAYVGMTSGLDYEFDKLKKAQSSSEVEDALEKLKVEINSESK